MFYLANTLSHFPSSFLPSLPPVLPSDKRMHKPFLQKNINLYWGLQGSSIKKIHALSLRFYFILLKTCQIALILFDRLWQKAQDSWVRHKLLQLKKQHEYCHICFGPFALIIQEHREVWQAPVDAYTQRRLNDRRRKLNLGTHCFHSNQ